MKPKYEVLTWDTDKQDFTPQKGVRRGPYTLFGLWKALRKLRHGGCPATRLPHTPGDGHVGDPSVLIQRVS